MKKAFVTLCVITMLSVTAFAGGGKGTTRYYAPKGTQGWFIDLAGTYSIFAANNCTYHDITTYYGGFNTNNRQHFFGATARVGRRVGTSAALRVAYDWHPSANQHGNFNFKSLHFDAMESPIDLFFGYNPERLYTLWVYGGVGLLAYDQATTHPYLIHWDSNLELGAHLGLMNNFRLTNSLDFHIDLTTVITRWSYDDNAFDGNGLWHRAHFDFSGMAGIMWYIGGRRLEVVDLAQADCSEQENRINELNNQIKDLEDQLANSNKGGAVVTDTIVKIINGEGQVVTYPFSIFFNKGSYELRDGRDRINLQEIAQAAIDHNLKINLRGTCDSGTASAAFNKTLAENRCNKVKNELVKIGVPAENITIEAVGGVTELKPAEYDRRVLIQFAK